MNKEFIIREKGFSFLLTVTKSNEIILERINTELDNMKTPVEGTYRQKILDVSIGFKVYRKSIKHLIDWIYKEKPAYFYWSTGGDETRKDLYKRFAKLVTKHGYYTTEFSDKYYCYRI